MRSAHATAVGGALLVSANQKSLIIRSCKPNLAACRVVVTQGVSIHL